MSCYLCHVKVTLLQHISRISPYLKESCLMEFSNGKEKICKILAKNNLINITWTCPLKVFPSENSYDICSKIWKRIYKNITLWLCHLKVLMLACDNVDTFNIFTIYLFQV